MASQGYSKPSYTPGYSAPAYPSPAYAKTPHYVKVFKLNNCFRLFLLNISESVIRAQAPIRYNFDWAVKDQPSYNDYAHQETADDKGYVTGSYRTLLPDGRTQVVNYKADDYTGYVADVKYEGDAKYQEYKPSSSYKPAAYPSPAYPRPAYPSPAYPAPKYPAKY